MILGSGTDILKEVIINWQIIREKFHQIGFETLDLKSDEQQFLEAKGKIARRLRPLTIKQGNPGDIHESIIRFLRRMSSLYQIQQLPPHDLRAMEKECHRIYIQLNRWLGEILVS